jgi:hypothetical protein
LSQLVSEIEEIQANSSAMIKKLREKHMNELSDIKIRAESKLKQLLDDQKAGFQYSRNE